MDLMNAGHPAQSLSRRNRSTTQSFSKLSYPLHHLNQGKQTSRRAASPWQPEWLGCV